MALTKVSSKTISDNAITADKIQSGAITVADIPDGEITAAKLHTTLDLTSKTITLNSPTISGNTAFDTDTLYIDSTNNRVGIGTATPSTTFDVLGAIQGGASLTLGTGVTTGSCRIEIGQSRTADGISYIDMSSASGADFNARILRQSGANGNWDLINTGTGNFTFSTNSTERMRINSAGNVGIGTSFQGAAVRLAINNTSGLQQLGFSLDNDCNINIRAVAGKNSSITFTEQTIADRWVIGTAAGDGSLRFATGASLSNSTERMRINSSGNVGIGTSSPGGKLDIRGASLSYTTVASPSSNIWTGKNFTFRDEATYGTGVGGAFIFEGRYNSAGAWSTYGWIRGSKKNATDGDIYGNMYYGTRYGHHIFVADANGYTNGTNEKMRITDTGNVGIGTSSPVAKFDLVDGNSKFLMYENVGNAEIKIISNTGADGALYFGDAVDNVRVGIKLDTSANALVFAGYNNAERMRINSAGNVGIGTSNPSEKLHVVGGGVNLSSNISNGAGKSSLVVEDGANTGEEGGVEIRAFAPRLLLVDKSTGAYTVNMVMDGVNFSWYQNTDANRYTTKGTERFRYGITTGTAYNTTGTWGTISDQNLKENVVDATPKLDEVKQLQVRNFNLIGEDLKQIGFVAQEIEQVFPNIVDTQVNEEDGTETKYVKTTVLIPILTKALQEAKTEIDDLKSRIQVLENK